MEDPRPRIALDRVAASTNFIDPADPLESTLPPTQIPTATFTPIVTATVSGVTLSAISHTWSNRRCACTSRACASRACRAA